MSRMFNPINGQELATIVCRECDQVLDLDSRFESDEPVALALAVTFTLRVEQHQIEQPFVLQVSNIFKGQMSPKSLKAKIKAMLQQAFASDLRFGLNITYPRFTYEHRISFDPLPGTTPLRGTVQETNRIEVPLTADPMADRRIDTRGPVQVSVPSIIVDPNTAEIALLEQRLAALRGSVGVGTSSDQIPPSHVIHRDYEPVTGTGLEITRGWAQSPGDGMAQSWGDGAALGVVQTREAISNASQRIELGVSHPPLSEGGVPAPDAMRRDFNLPIPQMTVVGRQVVDLPEGTF